MSKNFFFFLCTFPLILWADETFPKKDYSKEVNPIASEDAEPGGEMIIFGSQYPKSFNYYLEQMSTVNDIFGLMYDSLLNTHPTNLKKIPGIIKSWSISKDQSVFTLNIDSLAKWSDGKAITAEDILWTYDTVISCALAGSHRLNLEKFHRPVVKSSSQIVFTAKEIHWSNINFLGDFRPLPKHILKDKTFDKVNFEFPVTSGAYKIKKIKNSVFLTLERREDWWFWYSLFNQNTKNFDTLKFKFFAERANGYESFKKGNIDFYAIYTSHVWVNQTKGQAFKNNWIIKQRVYNYDPISWQGFAMNLRRPLFQDKRVRKALAHLLDVNRMNNTLMFNQYEIHKSYFEDLYTKDKPSPNKSININKKKARELLKEAGWVANANGKLEKEGELFKFNFLTRSPSYDRFLNIFSEDLKDLGIEFEIVRKDWAAWSKDMDEYNYDMTWAAWGSSVFKNPESQWHSKEAKRKSGENITGYQNKDVDKLIEKQKEIYDVNTRHQICAEIDNILVHDFPYLMLWYNDYTRLLYWNKFGMPNTVLDKYSNEAAAYTYWWFDEDANANLDDSKEGKLPLPAKKSHIYFDKEYTSGVKTIK